MSKVFILGLDGATWRLMEPWILDGSLPHFAKLYIGGAHAKLESTIPPLTPPAWTSAFTGVNPGKHNIYDFVCYDGYQTKVVFTNSKKRESLWSYVGKNAKKAVVLNVPCTYPPEKINGVMICGMGTPSFNTDFVYPPEYKQMLFDKNYIIEFGGVREWSENKKAYLDKINEMNVIRKEITSHLLEKARWDLFISVFVSIDRVQHIFWRLDENGEIMNEDYQVLKSIYKQMDQILGGIIEGIGKETYVFIMSDHGFGPVSKGIYLNNYFREIGLLKLTNDGKKFSKFGLTQEKLVKVASKLGDLGLRKMINLVSNDIRSKIFEKTGMGLVDWDKTSVWFGTTSGHAVHINLRGRQPNGIVDLEDYDSFRDRLIEKLYALRDPSGGQQVIKKCYKRDEVYSGDYMINAPDIIVEPEEGYSVQEAFGSEIIELPKEGSVRRYGDHDKYGIFMGHGPDIKSGFNAGVLNICDLFPTVLHIMKMPLPNDLDGKVMKEIFKPDSKLASSVIRYFDPKCADKLKEKIIRMKCQGFNKQSI